MTAPRRASPVLLFALVMAMTMGAFQLIAVAIVANDMLDDLGMTEATFGVVGASNTIVGALFAPRSGIISDVIGPKRSVLLVLLISAAGLFVTAAAPNVWVLLGATLLSGFCQGWCNPATNKLIAERTAPGERGNVTGIKQSGVQLATLLGGLTLPGLALLSSWRLGMVVYGFVALAAAAVVHFGLEPDDDRVRTSEGAKADRAPLGRSIRLLTVYALLMGIVVGAIGRFLPLFTEDQLGTTNVVAGLISGLLGGLAVFTRIWWARAAERRIPPATSLMIQAGLSVVAMVMLLGSISAGVGLVWAMVPIGALGVNSWNAVAMLAVISGVPSNRAGRASGVVVMGFMSGLTIGGVYTGLVADVSDGNYGWAWATMAVLAAASVVVARMTASDPALSSLGGAPPQGSTK